MKLREDLSEENEEEFNEMGLMQAIDNITALLAVMKKTAEDGYTFNSKKVILYGNSHGAYLCHLCNILMPNFISLIIDNSGWIYPVHINKDRRSLAVETGKTKIKVVFDYIARNIIIPNNQYLESEKYRYIFNYDCGILNFVKCKK